MVKPHLINPGSRRLPSGPAAVGAGSCRWFVRILRRSLTMHVGLLGRKVGMTQIYQENGTVVPVTVLECGPCTVLQVRTPDTRRLPRVATRLCRQETGQGHPGRARPCQEGRRRAQAVRAGGPPGRADRSERRARPSRSSCSAPIAHVDVTGTSKGRGYAGVIKRHGFHGLRATHGVKRMHRHPGSSGPSADPARTQKGIRSPGSTAMPGSPSATSRSSASTPPTTCSWSKAQSRAQRRVSHRPPNQPSVKPR